MLVNPYSSFSQKHQMFSSVSFSVWLPGLSFIFKMVATLQIPPVFPCVSCLGSVKAFQCSHPGPKIGYKTQQIPHYSPVCPWGQFPKCVIIIILLSPPLFCRFLGFILSFVTTFNGSFPSCLVPLFQSKSKCKNDFDLHENETACRTHFHMKGFALRLILKQRHKRTQKWPIG